MKHRIGTRTEVSTNDDIAISVKDLHKSFHLPTEQAFGLKQAIFNRLRGIKGYKEQKVLRGLTFDIKKGDFIGFVRKILNTGQLTHSITVMSQDGKKAILSEGTFGYKFKVVK